MNKIETILYDVILHSSLIFNLIEVNKYNTYLLRFISILTIINCILIFIGYGLRKTLPKSELKKLKKAVKKGKSKIWKVYQYITNTSLILLFVFNGFITTAIVFVLCVKILSMFRAEVKKGMK